MSLYRLYSARDRRVGERDKRGRKRGKNGWEAGFLRVPQGGWNLLQHFAIFRMGMGQRSWNH